MFDRVLPEPAALRAGDDAAVVAAIEGWAQVEAAGAARRLDAIAELTVRRCADEERAHLCCDDWHAEAAEVYQADSVPSHRL